MRLAWQLLKTDWRSGELRLLFAALFLSVGVVTGLTLLMERLELMLVGESSQLLAADRVLKSPRPVDAAWIEQARKLGLADARYLHFQSMVYGRGDEPQLASVKAVEDGYPLRGQLRYRTTPGGAVLADRSGPRPGEIWAEARLFSLLGLNIGDRVTLGETQLVLTAELVSEPDRGAGLFSMGSRVLLHGSDIDKTGVVHTGSRVSWSYLFAGTAESIRQYEQWLLPRLAESHRWQDLQNSQPTVALTLQRVKGFFLLASSIIVILASLAIAMAASQFSQRHLHHVAVLKTLGATAREIRTLYAGMLLLLCLVAIPAAWLLAWFCQEQLLHVAALELKVELPPLSPWPFLLGLLTGLVSLLAFALPPVFRLGRVPAVAIFRIDNRASPLPGRAELGLAITGVVVILTLYTRSLLAAPLLLAMLVLFGFLLVLPVGWLLARFGRANMEVSGWKVLALSRIRRRLRINAFQVAVLAMALLLFVAMLGMRDNLFREWQSQLPEKTPNYFLVNIPQEEWHSVARFLQDADIPAETIYPMVRARLVEINHRPVSSLVSREELDRAGADRELNLSWSEALPPDNTLVEGRWGGAAGEGASIEQKLAERLSIRLGDILTFQSGSERFESTVTSIRTVEWDRMRPNFFLLLPRAQLERYPSTYMTSIYLPAGRSGEVVRLLQQFPTTVVIELDGIIAQIRRIIGHAARALELVLLLVIAGTLLVLWATVQGSLAERLQENTVLRALGGTGRLITGSLLAEFLFLGLVAGLLATAGAELVLLVLQAVLLDIPLSLHPGLWWVAPLAGSLLVGLAGLASAWRVIHTKPAELLREF